MVREEKVKEGAQNRIKTKEKAWSKRMENRRLKAVMKVRECMVGTVRSEGREGERRRSRK